MPLGCDQIQEMLLSKQAEEVEGYIVSARTCTQVRPDGLHAGLNCT